MKKIIASITLALMVIALPLALIGCNKKSANSAIAGKWVFWKSFSDESLTHEFTDKQDWNNVSYTFYKNNTAQWNDAGFLRTGKWEIKGNKLTFTYENEDEGKKATKELIFKNKKLIYVKDGTDGNPCYYVFIPEDK